MDDCYKISDNLKVHISHGDSYWTNQRVTRPPVNIALYGYCTDNDDDMCEVQIHFDEIVPLVNALTKIADDLGLSF